MSEHIEAYPLTWPAGWRRTSADRRARSKFHTTDYMPGQFGVGSKKKPLSVSQAIDRVARELQALNAWTTDTVISTNVPVQRSGLPYSNHKQPTDPGVAVYWKKGKATRCKNCAASWPRWTATSD